MMLQGPGETASPSAASRFAYDVFVVHTGVAADESFVQGYLLAKLGLPPERVFRLQALELGEFITEEIERGVRSSRVTIVVLSSAYMDDRWATFGERLAAYASVAEQSAIGTSTLKAAAYVARNLAVSPVIWPRLANTGRESRLRVDQAIFAGTACEIVRGPRACRRPTRHESTGHGHGWCA